MTLSKRLLFQSPTMFTKTGFSFRKLSIFSIAVLGLCFWAGNSMAQSEKETSEMEAPKPIDKPILENQSDLHIDAQPQHNIPAEAIVTSPKTTAAPKKDSQLSGEGKKPETAPSTLSFNIFLYIVDKFKAD